MVTEVVRGPGDNNMTAIFVIRDIGDPFWLRVFDIGQKKKELWCL